MNHPGPGAPYPGLNPPPTVKSPSPWKWILGITLGSCLLLGAGGFFAFRKVVDTAMTGPKIIYEESIHILAPEDATGFATYHLQNLGIEIRLPAPPVPIEMDELDGAQNLVYARAGQAEADDPDLPYTVYVYGVKYNPLMKPRDPEDVGELFVDLFEGYENIVVTSVERRDFPLNGIRGQRVDMSIRWAGEPCRIVGWGGAKQDQGAFFYAIAADDNEASLRDAFRELARGFSLHPPTEPKINRPPRPDSPQS